jgi:hypothetical protein
MTVTAVVDINIGSNPNDGTGDSIREAFRKSNDNFTFLDLARQNLVTGNLTASGNIKMVASVPSYWSGGPYYINGVEIATVGTTFSGGTVNNPTTFASQTPSISNTSGAVVITGGLGVGGDTQLTALYAKSVTIVAGLNTATMTVGGAAALQGGLTTTAIVASSAALSGAITALSIAVTGAGTFANGVTGTLKTNAQPFVNSVGTLDSLSVTGNIVAANITLTWGNVNAGNINLSGIANVGSLKVSSTTAITGNLTAGNVTSGIGTFGNLTVDTIPTVKSVTNKSYVTATVVGFAIGLGS